MPNEDPMNMVMRRQDEPYDRLAEAQHRLGTELGVIFACCYKLRQGTEKPLSPEAAALLHRIQRSAESIRDLRIQLINSAND
ncbi:MAG TPA: hypothetical protein VGH16_14070 [Candidatus Binatia bacterium]|jgi:hypothetical protein